jgi:hypothetical protein
VIVGGAAAFTPVTVGKIAKYLTPTETSQRRMVKPATVTKVLYTCHMCSVSMELGTHRTIMIGPRIANLSVKTPTSKVTIAASPNGAAERRLAWELVNPSPATWVRYVN